MRNSNLIVKSNNNLILQLEYLKSSFLYSGSIMFFHQTEQLQEISSEASITKRIVHASQRVLTQMTESSFSWG
jgi:hypothetical protein